MNEFIEDKMNAFIKDEVADKIIDDKPFGDYQ